MRFAIYYTPAPDSTLTRSASNWLGRNAFTGEAFDIHHGCQNWVGAPRRYGFHATMKAPFRLAKGVAPEDLRTAFQRFASALEPFDIAGLKIDRLGPFFALVPSEPSEQLNTLAAQIVRKFEPFRAKLNEDEIARRNPDTLTEEQLTYLEEWGYPYVFDEFEFHMTLTGPVEDDHAAAVRSVLDAHFAAHLDKPHTIGSLALFVEPEPGAPFVVDEFVHLGVVQQKVFA